LRPLPRRRGHRRWRRPLCLGDLRLAAPPGRRCGGRLSFRPALPPSPPPRPTVERRRAGRGGRGGGGCGGGGGGCGGAGGRRGRIQRRRRQLGRRRRERELVMNLPRLLRHLFVPDIVARRAFSRGVLKKIEEAIRTSEDQHDGQIRFVVEGTLPAFYLFRKK